MTPEQREAKRVYDAAYRDANKDAIRASHAAYDAAHREERQAYRDSRKDEQRAYDDAYYVAHREEKRAYSVAYNAAHEDEARAYQAAYRVAHGEEKRAYNAAYMVAHREEVARFHEWLQILRTVNGCEDCEAHEGWLEHHHVDPATKRCSVSDMAQHSLDALEDELEKCVVLCRPCHGTRHVEMRAA